MRRVKHIARGDIYKIIGQAECQGSLEEGDIAVVYREERHGKLWVRRHNEFNDGRFILLQQNADAVIEMAYTLKRSQGLSEQQINEWKNVNPVSWHKLIRELTKVVSNTAYA